LGAVDDGVRCLNRVLKALDYIIHPMGAAFEKTDDMKILDKYNSTQP
jgi:hypothetical protein